MVEDMSIAAIKRLLDDYMRLFSAGAFEAALAHYHLPFSWLVGPSFATAVTPEQFIAKMTAMRDGLVAQGFERTELVSCTVRLLGPDAALAGIEIARHFVDGRVEGSGGTYLLHRDGAAWRLVSIIAHPVEAIVGRNEQE